MSGTVTFLVAVNPQPWVVPPFSVGRRQGKLMPIAGRDQSLYDYQQVIAEQVIAQGGEMYPGSYTLNFTFFHQVEKYTVNGKVRTGNVPDVTNMQKAAEDALQGVVIHNDRDVIHTRATRIEVKDYPMVMIVLEYGLDPDGGLFDSVRNEWKKLRKQASDNVAELAKIRETNNEWPPR